MLGDGFALVVPPGTSPHLLTQARLTNATIRQVAILGREDATPVEPPIVGARDLRGDLAALLAGQPQGLYLLRPDRYVAAFLAADDIAAGSAEVERLMRETWPQQPAPFRPASATSDHARDPMTTSL